MVVFVVDGVGGGGKKRQSAWWAVAAIGRPGFRLTTQRAISVSGTTTDSSLNETPPIGSRWTLVPR